MPLFSIHLPNIKKTTTNSEQAIQNNTNSNIFDFEIKYDRKIPNELKEAFTRAKQHTLIHTSSFDKDSQDTTNQQTDQHIPIPQNFDSILSEKNTVNIPTFTDINFDVSISDLELYLKSNNIHYIKQDACFITQDKIIYLHDDTDFWIPDENIWFATGKQKISPINVLLKENSDKNRQPIIFLQQTNILDLDKFIQQAEESGIKIITDITQI